MQVIYLPSGLTGTFSGLSVTSGPILTFAIRNAVNFCWASLATILTAIKIFLWIFLHITLSLTQIFKEKLFKRRYEFCWLYLNELKTKNYIAHILSFSKLLLLQFRLFLLPLWQVFNYPTYKIWMKTQHFEFKKEDISFRSFWRGGGYIYSKVFLIKNKIWFFFNRKQMLAK